MQRCTFTYLETHKHRSKKRLLQPCRRDQSLLIILLSLFQYLTAGLCNCQQAFQHFKEQLLAHPSPLHPSAIPGELCTFGLHLTCANQASHSSTMLLLQQCYWILFHHCFNFWSLADYLSCASMGLHSNLLQNHPYHACLRSVDSIQFGQRGKVWIKASWKCGPDLSRDGSVIIALWFAN